MSEQEKPVISQSHLSSFYICGEAYRRSYIEGEKTPGTTAAARGSAVHAAAEENHKQKRKTGIDLPKELLAELADDAFTDIDQGRGIYLSLEEREIGRAPTLERARFDTRIAAEIYAEDVAPHMNPEAVEERIIVDIDGSSVRLSGKPDGVDVDGSFDDIKTTKGRGWGQSRADSSLQISMYGILIRALKGVWPREARIRSIDIRKGRATKITTHRTRRDYEIFANRINQFLAAREAGIFPPASPDSWACSPTWCQFWDSCPYVNPQRMARAHGKEG